MTTKALTFLVIAAFVLMGAWAQSQSGCAGLVQQGIYDKFSSSSTSSGYSQFVSNFCGNTSQYSNNQSSNASSYASSTQKSSAQSSSTSAGASVGIFDYGLGAHFSHSHSNYDSSDSSISDSQSASSGQIAILHQLLCDSSDNENDADNVVQQASQFVDPNAIEAYEQCLVQSAAGLQVSTTVYDDQVSISINYVPPIGTPAYTIINDIEISPPGSWNCTGLLWDISQGQFNQTLATEVAEMECTRNVSNSAFYYQGQSLTALPSSIIIMATSGTVIRNFGPLYSSTAKDIISSLAQEIAQLENEFNDVSSQIAPQLTEMQTQINTFSANISSLLANSSSLSDSFEPLPAQVASLNHSTQTDIAATCGDFSIQDDTVFWASCNRYDGTIMVSTWDLAGCVGIMDNEFVCLPGLPAVSAINELTLDETIMTGTLNGARVSVDLSSFLTNRNGRLECECEND